jgi:hypothetical protein
MHKIPLCIISVAVSFGNIGPIAKEFPVIGVHTALGKVVASLQLYTANLNGEAIELCPDSVALFIVDLVVLDLVFAVVVGSLKGDLISNLVGDISGVGITPNRLPSASTPI